MRKPPFLVTLLAALVGALLLSAFSAEVSAQAPTGPIAPQPGKPVQQAPAGSKIVTRVSLVNTPVTVKDSSGHMVHSLDEKDFQVTDNGVPQQIIHLDLGGDPLSIVFLVETSSRIAPLMPQINKAGIVLAVTVMGTNGEAAVVGFNDSVDKLQDFTTNQDAVEKTITKLGTVTDGSKLFDAMAIGVEMLSDRPVPTADTPGRRRIMLILSEATDVGSETKLGAVLRQAQLANVTIYAVGLSTVMAELKAPPKDTTPQVTPPGTFSRAPFPGSVQTPATEGDLYGTGNLLSAVALAVKDIKNKVSGQPLQLAAVATGGEDISTFKNQSIENAIDEIGGELHSQYSLSYTPRGTSDTGYHEIKVKVDKVGLKVRARPGYYLAGPEG
jgi:VWFA-related protein